jgi:chromate reductase, NAD(P)H dehydrogenase (quinone)
VGGADALFISTPAYNGAAPGVLKNALDWLSRPAGAGVLAGRVVALASASPGKRGAADAQPALRDVLTRCGARVVDHEPVAVGDAERLRGADGEFHDPEVVAALESLVDAVLAAARGGADALAVH